jgi:hypothetical protein
VCRPTTWRSWRIRRRREAIRAEDDWHLCGWGDPDPDPCATVGKTRGDRTICIHTYYLVYADMKMECDRQVYLVRNLVDCINKIVHFLFSFHLTSFYKSICGVGIGQDRGYMKYGTEQEQCDSEAKSGLIFGW